MKAIYFFIALVSVSSLSGLVSDAMNSRGAYIYVFNDPVRYINEETPDTFYPTTGSYNMDGTFLKAITSLVKRFPREGRPWDGVFHKLTDLQSDEAVKFFVKAILPIMKNSDTQKILWEFVKRGKDQFPGFFQLGYIKVIDNLENHEDWIEEALDPVLNALEELLDKAELKHMYMALRSEAIARLIEFFGTPRSSSISHQSYFLELFSTVFALGTEVLVDRPPYFKAYAFNSYFNTNKEKAEKSCLHHPINTNLPKFTPPLTQTLAYIFNVLHTVLSTDEAIEVVNIAAGRVDNQNSQVIKNGYINMKKMVEFLIDPVVIQKSLSQYRNDAGTIMGDNVTKPLALALKQFDPEAAGHFSKLVAFMITADGRQAFNQVEIANELSTNHADQKILLINILLDECLRVLTSESTMKLITEYWSAYESGQTSDFVRERTLSEEADIHSTNRFRQETGSLTYGALDGSNFPSSSTQLSVKGGKSHPALGQ